MSKVITLRYATKCKICKQEIPAGNRAIWFGKRQGSAHVECNKPKDVPAGSVSETVLRFPDLRQEFIASTRDGKTNEILSRPSNQAIWKSLIADRNSPGNWTGSTNQQSLDWLENGYRVPGLDGVDSTLIQGAPKRRIRFAEEGDEMLIDLALSGVDEHFMTWDKRETKPALKVRISCSFNAGIKSEIVNQYQSWVARMLQTIDAFGLDMQVDLVSPGRGQWVGQSQAEHTVSIRVKESGEASDFSNWSPMFSPAGFRHYTFLAIIKCADIHGQDVSGGLGSPIQANAWNVAYDKESETLTVSNLDSNSPFPEFEMTQKFIAIMQGVSGQSE